MEIKLPLGGLPSASRHDVASALPLSLLKPVEEGVINPVQSLKNTDKAQEAGQNPETQREVLTRTSELVSMLDIDLKFEVHEDAGIVQIQVIDTADGRV
ncbi:MAG: flagellar protein FlaG, partial [Synergistaceae bacterium]|nr:flagellar protein FlaG [Synergistaceae bacterium]